MKWKNTALLVIDMQVLLFVFLLSSSFVRLINVPFCFYFQKDFILPGGPMHVKGGAAIVPNVIEAVKLARRRGIPIIWVPFCFLLPCSSKVL